MFNDYNKKLYCISNLEFNNIDKNLLENNIYSCKIQANFMCKETNTIKYKLINNIIYDKALFKLTCSFKILIVNKDIMAIQINCNKFIYIKYKELSINIDNTIIIEYNVGFESNCSIYFNKINCNKDNYCCISEAKVSNYNICNIYNLLLEFDLYYINYKSSLLYKNLLISNKENSCMNDKDIFSVISIFDNNLYYHKTFKSNEYINEVFYLKDNNIIIASNYIKNTLHIIEVNSYLKFIDNQNKSTVNNNIDLDKVNYTEINLKSCIKEDIFEILCYTEVKQIFIVVITISKNLLVFKLNSNISFDYSLKNIIDIKLSYYSFSFQIFQINTKTMILFKNLHENLIQIIELNENTNLKNKMINIEIKSLFENYSNNKIELNNFVNKIHPTLINNNNINYNLDNVVIKASLLNEVYFLFILTKYKSYVNPVYIDKIEKQEYNSIFKEFPNSLLHYFLDYVEEINSYIIILFYSKVIYVNVLQLNIFYEQKFNLDFVIKEDYVINNTKNNNMINISDNILHISYTFNNIGTITIYCCNILKSCMLKLKITFSN